LGNNEQNISRKKELQYFFFDPKVWEKKISGGYSDYAHENGTDFADFFWYVLTQDGGTIETTTWRPYTGIANNKDHYNEQGLEPFFSSNDPICAQGSKFAPPYLTLKQYEANRRADDRQYHTPE